MQAHHPNDSNGFRSERANHNFNRVAVIGNDVKVDATNEVDCSLLLVGLLVVRDLIIPRTGGTVAAV